MNVFQKIRAKKNANRLLQTCLDLIVKYEQMNPALKPSCVSDMRNYISQRLELHMDELAEWDDNEDYVRVAHTLIVDIAYDLLASGEYHLYYGILNPMNCSSNLLFVYKRCLDYGVSVNMIDEDTKESEISNLMKRISEVG